MFEEKQFLHKKNCSNNNEKNIENAFVLMKMISAEKSPSC